MKVLLVLVGLVLIGVAVLAVLRKSAKARLENDASFPQIKSPTLLTKHATLQNDRVAQETEAATVVNKVLEPLAVVQEKPETLSSAAHTGKQERTAEIIPEDSMLRRHYLSTRLSERESISHPYPTDSLLRRHYESMRQRQLKPCAAVSIVEISEPPLKKLSIPEDATLKRHFLTQLQAEIESLLFPRPTDSILRRHYDHQVKVKLDGYLTGQAV